MNCKLCQKDIKDKPSRIVTIEGRHRFAVCLNCKEVIKRALLKQKPRKVTQYNVRAFNS